MISRECEDPQKVVAGLAQFSDDGARLTWLRKNRHIFKPSTVEFLYEEVVKLVRADVRQADRLARAADWMAQRMADDACRAQACRAIGHVSLARGHFNEALRSYEEALGLYRSLGRDVDVGRTLYGGSLQALIYLGQYEKALAWAAEARRIFERLGDRLRLARLDTNTGNILYRQERFEEALECYERALEEFRGHGEPQDIAIALRNIAVCHISLTRFEKALETYREGRAHCELSGMPLMVVESDYNIAYLHYQRGEYAKAIELYQSTRKSCDAFGDPYHKALCDLDQSEMYTELNLDEEGAQLAERAATAFHELGLRYEEAKAITFRALAASRLGKTVCALEWFGRARALFAVEENRIWRALVDLYQAEVLYQGGKYARAGRLCQSAYSVFSASALETKATLCQLMMARLQLRSRDVSGAYRSCEAALAAIEETEAPALGCQAHFVMGQILEKQQDFRAASRSYRKAHALMENLRSLLKTDDVKVAFLKDKLAIYESLVWMCLRGKLRARNKAAAFAYIEQAKSRSLADLISLRAPDLPVHGGPRRRLSVEMRALREELHWHSRQIEQLETNPKEQSAGRLANLYRGRRGCEDRLVLAMAELARSDEHFGVLHGAGTIRLGVIQAALPKDVILLEYYQARGSLFVIVLGRDTLEFVPLTDADRVRQLLRLLQFQLSKYRLGPEYVRRFEVTLNAAVDSHLRALYDVLLAPVSAWLKARHLVIVPHDFLHYLPFHALHDGSQFLIDKIPVTYAPSAGVYHLCCSQPTTSRNRSLVFGIPDPQTPHVTEEARQVASALPNPRLFLGGEATERELRAHGPKSRFIHIAAHGLFRQDNPLFSSMRLGDSSISLLDLYSLRLSAELVTLSGCSTGMNTVVGGDEILGLVRGLLYAGTRAVLVSQWDVDDKSTADFMGSFYRHLSSDPDKGRALQMAMQDIRKEYSHPYYWAPFVLIGKADGNA
jgi:CHAT domain-containing protein/predicted negative regulator of RcsB-dependent stress response